MNLLVRLERKLDIYSSVKRIFGVISDIPNMPKWNKVVNKVIGSGDDITYKSTIGDITFSITSTSGNERISMSVDEGPMTSMGFIIKPKVEVILWAEYDKIENDKMILDAVNNFLISLKKYSEYLEKGGNPDEFKKE